MVVGLVRYNPSEEGVAIVRAGSGTEPMVESLYGARAVREVGLGLGSGLCFEFFDSELSLLDNLLFLKLLFPLLLFLLLAPPPPIVVAYVSAVGFMTQTSDAAMSKWSAIIPLSLIVVKEMTR